MYICICKCVYMYIYVNIGICYTHSHAYTSRIFYYMYITSNTCNTIYTILCVYLCVFVYLCVCLCVCLSLRTHTARAGGYQRRRARILLRETTIRHDFFHPQCLSRLSIYTGHNIYIYIITFYLFIY